MNEIENNSTSSKWLVRDKSSFCPPRNRNKGLDQIIDFLNHLETDIIDNGFESKLRKKMSSFKLWNSKIMKISLLKTDKDKDKGGAVTICQKSTTNKRFMTM